MKAFLSHIFILFFFSFFNIIQAQDTINKSTNSLETADIQFLRQWPSLEGNNKAKSLATRIKKIIFGKDGYQLSKPVSIIVNNQNALWILDQGNNVISRVSKEVGEVPHFIEKKHIAFPSLAGICTFQSDSNKDEILVTDSYLNKIFCINSEKKECRVLNDSLVLNQPTGIAYSKKKKEIWVIETGAHCITVLNEKGQRIKKIGSRGSAYGEFNFPTHIWIDKDGNAYIVDAMNFRVQIFNKEGNVVSVFGSNGDASGFFASPKGIATDSYGNIYVVDALFNLIQIFDNNGELLSNFGAQGQGIGQFWMPSGIYIDVNDRIYIADSYNSRVQVFQLITGSEK